MNTQARHRKGEGIGITEKNILLNKDKKMKLLLYPELLISVRRYKAKTVLLAKGFYF